MAFADIPKIEKYNFYTELAFRKATKVTNKQHKRQIMKKFDAVKESLDTSLKRILLKYPNIDDLDPFYNKLFKATLDYPSIKKALGSLVWCTNKIAEFHRFYIKKIAYHKDSEDKKRLNQFRIQFYGRVNSCVKQIRKELELLEESRRVIKEFPIIKTGMKTVSLVGFPNVGKTTLLFKLTGSKADIQPYAFTTKGINVSYYVNKGKRLQLLDTPGTLNRLDKMNTIEYIAYLAMEELADFLVYVFDPTEHYTIEEQIKLYKRVKKYKKKVYAYISKRDICKDYSEELNKFNPLTFDELKDLFNKTIDYDSKEREKAKSKVKESEED
ncbi:50S ribosome-binding GTPase [Candidatus Woesearchaeota archaeon]|nr:50S ribosome-binding GTPase [Candidatus Woesearchaeota archaeon]